MELILIVVAILFVASLTRSTFGFGDALVAMPLLALLIGVKSATPLVALIGLSNAILILVDSWNKLDFKAASKLLIGGIFGIPIGMYALIYAPESIIKGILGLLLIGFSVYNLAKPRLSPIQNDRWAYPFGFFAGMLGGAYNTNGPLAVVYGTLRCWPPANFRATMQGFLLPANFLITIGHGLNGLWTLQLGKFYLFSLPAVFAASYVGSLLNRKFEAERFTRMLFIILFFLGLLMFF